MIKPNKKQFDYDVIIVGGGMAGMAAAISLSKLDLSICLLEYKQAEDDSHPSYDDRTLVVNRASICFWKNLGIWEKLTSSLTVINKVHVSNKGHFGVVNFDKDELNVEYLAYIIEAKKLGFALKKECEDNDKITIICPAQYQNLEIYNNTASIKYKKEKKLYEIEAKLILAADGIQSIIRSQLGLKTLTKSYERTAIICNITPELKHNNCAYERLSQSGPTAMLPFISNRCGFVWSVEERNSNKILELSDEKFLEKAQNQFGYRLGKFRKVGKRSSYPLYLVTVPKQVKSRVVLIGNAAHGMSPVSAQGLNLAVRDIANLFDVIKEAIKKKQDIGIDKTLNSYVQAIVDDQKQTMSYTDDLMNWFKIDEPTVSIIRSAGLFALEQSKQMKLELFKRASGYRGTTPKMLRQKT